MSTITITPEINALKARLKETWTAGDYDRFSRYMEQGARIFYEQLDVPAGCQLLDVACGSGQVALWAARDGVKVTGVDIAPNLVQRAQARANAEGLYARFREGDAEALPFEDASFDVVTSLVGAMFAPRPELVARELLRVCSPGGTIAMGNWTRDGFIGEMFNLRKVHRSFRHAGPGVVGGRGCRTRETGPRSFRPCDDAPPIQLHLPFPAGRSGRVFPAVLWAYQSRVCFVG